MPTQAKASGSTAITACSTEAATSLPEVLSAKQRWTCQEAQAQCTAASACVSSKTSDAQPHADHGIEYREYLHGDPWDGCEDLKEAGLQDWRADFLKPTANLDPAILLEKLFWVSTRDEVAGSSGGTKSPVSHSLADSTDIDSCRTSPNSSARCSIESMEPSWGLSLNTD